MARYKDLTKKKRDFLKELMKLDNKHNFLEGPEFAWITEVINEGRYLSEDSEWANKIFQKHKETYFKLKNPNK